MPSSAFPAPPWCTLFPYTTLFRSGVDLLRPLADVGAAQDGQALGVGGHEAVLDAVVDHLDEVAGAVGPAVQVAALRGAAGLLPPRRDRKSTRLNSSH